MTDDIKDVVLKSLRGRLEEVREMLMQRGVSGERIYNCDEWAAPTTNLKHAINLIDATLPLDNAKKNPRVHREA